MSSRLLGYRDQTGKLLPPASAPPRAALVALSGRVKAYRQLKNIFLVLAVLR
jgi:hypothetical protein